MSRAKLLRTIAYVCWREGFWYDVSAMFRSRERIEKWEENRNRQHTFTYEYEVYEAEKRREYALSKFEIDSWTLLWRRVHPGFILSL